MAVTKIWPVKDSLARVVDYAQNPDKTIYSDLQAVLHYAANTEKTIEELKACELIPFRDGIQAGIPCIMVGHFSLPHVTQEPIPASLSSTVITELLREEMGFEGIIITDAMNMGAVAQQYSSAESAVMALKAGNDMILMPGDFKAAYQGVLDAVDRGELTIERIDASLRRILRVKMAMQTNET